MTRWLLGIAAVLLLFWLARQAPPEPRTDARHRHSIFFTDATGNRGLFLTMQELLGRDRVGARRAPLDSLDEKTDTLIVTGPVDALTLPELDGLTDWVAAGGQLVLASDDGWKLADETISADGRRVGTVADYFGQASEPIRYGNGQVVLSDDPAVGSNHSIASGQSAAWFVRLADWRNGRVAFDEYHQGFGKSRGDLENIATFLRTPWGWVLLQLSLVGLLYLLFIRARLGAVVHVSSDPAPLDAVHFRVSAFKRALATELAAQQVLAYLAFELRDPQQSDAEPEVVLARVRSSLVHDPKRWATVRKLDRLLILSRRGPPSHVSPLRVTRLACEILKEVTGHG